MFGDDWPDVVWAVSLKNARGISWAFAGGKRGDTTSTLLVPHLAPDAKM